MDTSPINEALVRYAQLVGIEERQKNASEALAQWLGKARDSSEASLRALLAQPEVHDPLADELARHDADAGHLAFLQDNEGLLTPEELAAVQKKIAQHEASPKIQLARRFLGGVATDSVVEPSLRNPVASTSRQAGRQRRAAQAPERQLTNMFLSRPPEVVAEAIKGMKLRVGTTVLTITDTLPQGPADNERWRSDPVFGPNRVDAYVGPFRGAKLLFVRAGDENDTLSCVRIVRARDETSEYKTATAVCRALGLDSKVVGSVRLDGDTFEITFEPVKN